MASPHAGAIDYSGKEETDFPKSGSKQKAEAVRKAIGEIREMSDKPEMIDLNL